MKKRTACVGTKAPSTAGSRTMCGMPSRISVTNHASVTGPNTFPIPAVPRLCMRNSAARIPIVSGMMNGLNAGVTTSCPSTALSTDTAGVIIPSP